MLDGTMLTTSRLNDVLEKISRPLGERVTSRDFRGAIPTLLARQGAKTSELKMLGRWSSKAFHHYIKRGRANNWKQLKSLFSSLNI